MANGLWHFRRTAILGTCLASLVFAMPVDGLSAPDAVAEPSAEEARQIAVAERFLTVLEKTPRRGTALDRVYGHHVEFGTLDAFLDKLRSRVKESADDGVGWMLLGLFESHRGEDANAVDAFREAERLRGDDALASYYLGQALLLIGQPEAAVEAFERAIVRKPPRNDLLEIFQQLGRVHQRAQRSEQALNVWQRLESLFPDDPRVQEQIAVTLVEEGQYKLALPRYEKLATLVDDDYRRTMFRIQAADLKIRESRKDEGLADLEALLGDLNPESWLHRDVRRRIEDVFLRAGDQDGLVKYYERWIAGHGEDVDSMTRLAKFLASSARVPEATTWMEKALKLAPSRIELRKAFIDQLVDEQKYPEAAQQYALLVESAPGNVDFLREWGKLILKDKDQPQDVRTKEATRIWKQILAARADDAPTVAQVADLFRQANINDDAIALYQQAVALAPEDPQYREYLGEFYHILKRSDEALKTWQAIAAGSRRNAVNVARLAEIYNSFGYLDQAVAQIAEACRLDPKDFSLQIKGAEYHARASKFDEALTFVDAAGTLAASDEERDTVVQQRIEVFQSSSRLDQEIEKLAASVRADATAGAAEWQLLARYYEADRRWTEATEAVETALAKDAKSIPTLTTAARIAELSGDYSRAAEMNRQLSDVDRRSRGDHLMNVARLQAQLGRADEALNAGRELIVSAPGNTENHEFYAQLCFRLGKMDEGLETLRKAVRINPTEPHLIMALGAALSEQFRADEAIEVYWRAFEKTEELEDKTNLTSKLTELYLLTNQFDKLVERFERDRREDDKRREMTICLAQAHHTSGDYGTARQELESLLSEETRDTNLLQQLSKLCEEGADIDAAIEYQRQLVAIAPGHESEFRLAGMLQTRGDRDEASEMFVKLTRREESPERRLRSVDSLLSQGSYESVLAITEPLLSEQRDDWELLYREGVAWVSLEKVDEARDRFERLLTLNVPHDALGASAAERLKQAQSKARSDNLRGVVSQIPSRQSPLQMLNLASQVRAAVGLDMERMYFGGSSRPRVFTPEAFGVARMAAYGWLLKFEEDAKTAALSSESTDAKPSFVDALAERFKATDASRESIYDWLYVEQLRGNYDSVFQTSKRLARQGGEEEQRFYLSSLRLRDVDANVRQVRRTGESAPKKEPLNEEELALMLSCYAELTKNDKSDEMSNAMPGGQVIRSSNGQMYVNIGGSYVQLAGRYSGTAFLGIVAEELKLAGRDEQAFSLLQEQIGKAKKASEVAGAVQVLISQERFDQLPEIYPKWVAAAIAEVAQAPATAPTRATRGANASVDFLSGGANFITQWMGKLGPEDENPQIISILDSALDLAIAEGQKRRSQRPANARTPAANTNSYRSQWSMTYGKEQFSVQVDFPPPNLYVDQSALMVLRASFEILKRNDVLSDLSAHLQARVAKAEPDDKLYEQLMLGYVLWWMDEQDEALVQLAAANELLQDDPLMRLDMAALFAARGDFDDALAVVESLSPRDQQLVQRRELMALELAERLGDNARARQSAERLFGLRLDNDTQLSLVDRMRRLGLHDMAEAILSRVHRRAGNQTSSLASLMAMYQGQGKTELAQQIAHTVLRRTSSPLSGMSGSSMNPFRYRTADSSTRTQALRVLQQTGALPALIERIEGQLEKSPNSPRLYDQLIEFYQAANERDKVQKLLERAVAERPQAVALRYQLAKQLESAGKVTEACDQYLELLKQRPEWVADDLYSVQRVFERCQRTLELVKAVESMNLKSIRQPYYVVNLATELMRNEEHAEVAIKLFERVFNDFPAYRGQLVQGLHEPKLWKNPRIYQLGKRGAIPSKTEAAADPWYGISAITSYSGGGQVNGTFHQLLGGVQGTENAKDLRAAIEAGLAESPGWHGGQAMLSLMELKAGQHDSAKQRLETVLADEGIVKEMPSGACWMIGQELDQFDDTRALALRLFEQAASDQQSMSQFEYSPITRLVKLYADTGRKEDARELMLKQLRGIRFEQYDAQYSMYQRVENTVWVGGKLLELGFPVETVRLYKELSNDPQGLEQAAEWNGNDANYYQSQVKTGLAKALGSLDESNAGQAMEQLLVADAKVSSDRPALDLMLTVPEVTALHDQAMTSPLVEILQSISKNDSIRDGIERRLGELRAQHPTDLSIGVTLAAYQLAMKSESAAATLQGLEKQLADQPLVEVPAGKRPNSRQRREALLATPLWLVARQCLSDEAYAKTGEMLAERALAGARMQVDKAQLVAMLYDWGNLSLARGDRQQAERKWSELLDRITERPERKPNAAQPPGSPARPAAPLPRLRNGAWRSAPAWGVHSLVSALYQDETKPAAPDAESIPPLTLTQFRVTVQIAVAAAENGMPALSRKAVRAALAGGIPVPDPTQTATAGGGRILRVASGAVYASAANASGNSAEPNGTEAEVATSLQNVLEKWTGDDYPPREVYELLHPIVLPAARATEILLYADSSQIREAQAKSLGATLVFWAKNAGTLDDLRARVEARKQNPAVLIPALVLQTQIALASDKLDAAETSLRELSAAVEQVALPALVQQACHAALPASEHQELADPAYAILKKAVQLDAQSANSDGDNVQVLGELAVRVNRHLAGSPAEVQAFYETYLVGRQPHYARYGGDYGQYLQWNDFANIAQAAAKSGVPTVALDFIGRVADFTYENYSRPSVTTAIAIVCRDLTTKPAQLRYEAWRNWTLPQEGRQTVRLAAEWVRPVNVPPVFLALAPPAGKPHVGDLSCNMTELISAAQEAGKLEELRDEARQAHEQKLANAETLWLLTLIQMGDASTATPAIKELIRKLPESTKPREGQPASDLWTDYLVYRACMQSREFAQIYGDGKATLTDAIKDRGWHHLLAHIEDDFARRTAEDTGATIRPGDRTLLHWLAASTRQEPTDLVKPWWAANEGHLAHLCGSGSDLLCFAYPLTGDFTFSVDCYRGSWKETDAGYGGIIVEALQSGSETTVWTASGHEQFGFGGPLSRNEDGFNHVDVRVAGGVMQYFVNQHLVYQEPASPTSPWLLLYTDRTRVTAFKNLRITGEPVIPRDVALVSEDRLDGWNTSFYGERQPRKRLMARTPRDENDQITYEQRSEPADFDWSAKDGVLHGRALTQLPADAQSWMSYHRPLQDQETVRYEFHYVPDKSSVHPSIGRLAIIIAPDGVRSHWISHPGWDDVLYGIQQSNEVVEPAYRRGPDAPPLKEHDWNTVETTIHGDQVIVSLNGTVVYERPLEPVLDRRFGLFRRRQQSAEVRKITLSGPWPETLTTDIRNDLIAARPLENVADRRLVQDIFGEFTHEHSPAEQIARSRTLPPDQAYELLRGWVLPSPERDVFRLYCQRNPTTGGGATANGLTSDLLQCPAIELVAVAERCGKLAELKQSITEVNAEQPIVERGKWAMASLAAIQSGELDVAEQSMRKLFALLESGLPKTLSRGDRAPEFVVIAQAMQKPELQFAAADLALRLRDLERDEKTSSGSAAWRTEIEGLAGDTERCLARWDVNSASPAQSLTQWTAVPYWKPDLRGKGYRPSDWRIVRGAAQHVPAETWSQLFFQSPVLGKFEIHAELALHGWREQVIAYGMHAAEPRYDYKAKRISKVMHGSQEIEGELNLPHPDWIGNWRIVVDGSKVTTFVNDTLLHEETLAPRPDPWVVLQSFSPGLAGRVRDLRVVGNPEIPAEINLLETAGSAGWRADMYRESFSVNAGDDDAPWKRVGGEILGQLNTTDAATPRESLLMYQRPFLEDGVLEFESFFVPDELVAHPTLGRSAILVRPDGVKLHLLTDAEWESTGLAPGNESSLDGAASAVALKANDWNHYRLAVTGDVAALSVNGVEVARLNISEPKSERTFGLFRYADRDKCRVRNIVYRGDWPKQFPAVEDQQLAVPSAGALARSARQGKTLEFDLAKPIKDLQAMGVATFGPADHLNAGAKGVRLELKNSSDPAQWPGLAFKHPVFGDCDVILDFEQLNMIKVHEGWGAGMSFKMLFDVPHRWAEVGVYMDAEGRQLLKCTLAHRHLNGQVHQDSRTLSGADDSGRLRMVRQGAMLHCLYARKGSEQFRLLESYPIGAASIAEFRLENVCSDAAAVVDVVASKLILTLPDSPQSLPQTETNR